MIYTYSFDDSDELYVVQADEPVIADALLAVVTEKKVARRWLPEEFIGAEIAVDDQHKIVKYITVETACLDCENPESFCTCPIENAWWGDDDGE